MVRAVQDASLVPKAAPWTGGGGLDCAVATASGCWRRMRSFGGPTLSKGKGRSQPPPLARIAETYSLILVS